MEMTVRMPANYNLMTEDEMTYTTGGADAGSAAAIITGGISLAIWGLGLYNWIDQLLGARRWYAWIDQLLGARRWYAANKTGNLGTDLEKGIDTWLNYTTSSVLNCVRSVLATASSLGSPIGWVATALAFGTV